MRQPQQQLAEQHRRFLDLLACRDDLTGLCSRRRHLNKVLSRGFKALRRTNTIDRTSEDASRRQEAPAISSNRARTTLSIMAS